MGIHGTLLEWHYILVVHFGSKLQHLFRIIRIDLIFTDFSRSNHCHHALFGMKPRMLRQLPALVLIPGTWTGVVISNFLGITCLSTLLSLHHSLKSMLFDGGFTLVGQGTLVKSSLKCAVALWYIWPQTTTDRLSNLTPKPCSTVSRCWWYKHIFRYIYIARDWLKSNA